MSRFSRRDLVLVVAISYGWFVVLVALGSDYRSRIDSCGDNPSYARESAMLRGAAPREISGVQHFLGYPLLVTPVASLAGDVVALPVVSAACSIVAVVLAGTLWGPLVAALFATLNFDWLQRSLLGGADPVLAMFVFASFLAARRGRWILASLLAAAATIVRPFGICSLLAIGLVLLLQREWRRLAIAVVAAGAVGIAYFLFLDATFGQPMAHFAFYRRFGLGVDPTFIPFVTIWQSVAGSYITTRNVVKALIWMSFTVASATLAIRRRSELAEKPGAAVEWTFGVLYLASFFFFPAWWIESEFQRYVIPVIPLLLVAVEPWLPRGHRWVLLLAVAVSSFAALKTTPLFEAWMP